MIKAYYEKFMWFPDTSGENMEDKYSVKHQEIYNKIAMLFSIFRN